MLFVGISASDIQAQKELKLARQLVKDGEYCEAINHYDEYLKKFVNKNALMSRAKCLFHCNRLDEAINDFENARLLGYIEDDIEFYLARCFHHKLDFDKAIIYYKKYMALNKKDEKLQQQIINEINNCSRGIELSFLPQSHYLENYGPIINSSDDEINIFLSPNKPGNYYYTSNRAGSGKYAIYVYTRNVDNEAIIEFLNEDRIDYNERLSEISKDGSILFHSVDKNSKTSYKLLVDQYAPGKKALEESFPFPGPINFEASDRDFSVIDDSTFLFSSRALPGYGGYDIFITGFRKGYWFKPINLGSTINTEYNEISPYYTSKMNSLFFSSDNRNSIGAYDIFEAIYDEENSSWTTPVNLGIPVNSAADDLTFRFDNEGINASLTSNRKNDNFGGFDVYRVFLNKSWFTERPINRSNAFFNSLEYKAVTPNTNFPQKSFAKNKSGLNDTHDISDKNPDFISSINLIVEKEIELFERGITEASNDSTFVLPSTLFIKDSSLLSKQLTSNQALATYINLLQRFPQSQLTAYIHSSQKESKSESLKNGEMILEELKKHLSESGISENRLCLFNAGASLPLARNSHHSALRSAASKYNNRIELFLKNVYSEKSVLIKEPFVVHHIKDSKWLLYKSLLKGLSYKIKLSNVDDYIKIDNVDFIDDFIFSHNKNGSYECYTGIFKEYKKAATYMRHINKAHKLEARIIPFINDIQINDDQVPIQAESYKDLINYLESN